MVHTLETGLRTKVGEVPALVVSRDEHPRGRTVIVLHGFASESRSQRKELDSLAERGFVAVCIDAPHHGRRKGPLVDEIRTAPEPRSHELMLQVVDAAMRELP